MKIKKILYVILGCIGLALGAVWGHTAASSGLSVFAFGGVLLCQKFRKTAPLVYGNKAV